MRKYLYLQILNLEIGKILKSLIMKIEAHSFLDMETPINQIFSNFGVVWLIPITQNHFRKCYWPLQGNVEIPNVSVSKILFQISILLLLSAIWVMYLDQP